MRRTLLENGIITVIRLDEPTADCWVCGQETYLDFGLAVYEDEILPNNWSGEWFGATVCPRCYDLFNDKVSAPLRLITAQRLACGDFA
jgi:hypothetical protein